MRTPAEDRTALIEGKETVVRARGNEWSFSIPEGHLITINNDRSVSLISKIGEASEFELVKIDNETDDEEVVVFLGDWLRDFGPQGYAAGYQNIEPIEPRAYPVPYINNEIDRLRARWKAIGGDLQEIEAWAQGSSYETHLRRIRGDLRKQEGRT